MSEDRHVICPECKTANPASGKFCSNCGASLEGAVVMQEVAAEKPKKKRSPWTVVILAAVGLCLISALWGSVLRVFEGDGEGTPAATEGPLVAGVEVTEPAATKPAKPTRVTDTPAPTETSEPPTETVIPTETPIPSDTSPPTETPIPSDTPLPTATLEPTATRPPAVVIQGATAYASEYGTYHVVGEVQNNSDDALNFVKVVGTFYDDQNQVVATDFTYTSLHIVDAGSLAPFDLTLLDPPNTISSYKLAVQYNQAYETPLRVTITSHSGSMSEYGTYNVIGEVKNDYGFPINFVKIVGTFYDAAGNVVRADFTYTGLNTLAAGQTSPFDLALLDPPAEMDHYVLQTQANRP
jgi:hypothetical protein